MSLYKYILLVKGRIKVEKAVFIGTGTIDRYHKIYSDAVRNEIFNARKISC